MGGLASRFSKKESSQEVLDEIRNGPGPVLLTIPNEESKENLETESKSGTSFSVLSYNILAEVYSSHFYSEIDGKYIYFPYRSSIIIEELRKFASDIICLQEVDNFEKFYKAKIEELGYNVLFAQRPNGSPDGVVVAARKDTFEVLSHEIMKFDEGHQFEKRLDFRRGNVAIIAKLKHVRYLIILLAQTEKKLSNEVINFVGTHFFWDPRYEHVKYLQMHQIIQHVNSKLTEEDIVVWAGDLNSKPYCNALQFVLHGLPPSPDNLECPKKEMIDTMQILYENLKKVEQKIKWGNVYENYGAAVKDNSRKYPAYTNYTTKFKDTIDHILYSRNNLIPKKLLKLPTETEINAKALPNRRYPSDHLPLMSVFEITRKVRRL